jgi:hypothetical protein
MATPDSDKSKRKETASEAESPQTPDGNGSGSSAELKAASDAQPAGGPDVQDCAESSSPSAETEKDALSSMLSKVASATTGQSDSDKPSIDGEETKTKDLTESQKMHQHHVSKILDEVLEEPDESQSPARIRHPMVLDILLAVSLLFAMGGFTAGLFKMYIAHSAQQSIMQHNYKAAIAILKGAPLPGFIAIPGGSPDSDPQELLNQALYLDGMEKLDSKTDVNGGLNELQQIQAGSRFFTLAQEAINENFEPSSTRLEMGIEHEEKNPQPEKKPFVPEYPKDTTP